MTSRRRVTRSIFEREHHYWNYRKRKIFIKPHKGVALSESECLIIGVFNYKVLSEFFLVFFFFHSFAIDFIVYHTVCPGSSDQILIVTYHIKWDTTSWTDGSHIMSLTKVHVSFDYLNLEAKTTSLKMDSL